MTEIQLLFIISQLRLATTPEKHESEEKFSSYPQNNTFLGSKNLKMGFYAN